MSTEEEGEIGRATIVGSLTTWPGIVVLRLEKLGNKLNFAKNTERVRDVQRTLRLLREV